MKKVVKKSKKKIVPKVLTKKVRVRKIKIGRILLTLATSFLFFYLLSQLVKFPIRNIFIYNNELLQDYEIIEYLELEDYPTIFYKTTNGLEKKLKKNILIKNASVKKIKLSQIHIYIEDNYPIFYDSTSSLTYFQDGRTTSDFYKAPLLVNYVPDTIYNFLIKKMSLVEPNILNRISEIKYDPNQVDEERFLFTMTDGNYIYVTLETLNNVNSYVDIYIDIIKNYGNKKGILYLDSGEYFEIIN